jgi:hypothetical protein
LRKTLTLPKRPEPSQDAVLLAVLAERERCAAICERLAKYIEDGQIPRSPDRRLRQAAKYIREAREA